MGEYATRKSDRQHVKIGTCEDMYYLRFDQRHLVTHESGNVDPIADATDLRFRFPWPDEDTIKPGEFDDYHRSIRVDEFETSMDGVEHYSVQFTAHNGYLTSLPCPEAGPINITDSDGVTKPLTIHKNCYGGRVHLVAQKLRPEIGLVPILKCGGCGAMWRLEDISEIERLAVALRSQADEAVRLNNGMQSFLHTIADRILDGLTVKTA